jgi:replicative DNA helicase
MVSEALKALPEPKNQDALLMEITAEVVSAAQVVEHIKRVKEMALRREAIAAAGRMTELAWDTSKPLADALEGIQSQAMALGDAAADESGLRGMREILTESWKEWREAAAGKITGVKTGLGDLDAILGALRPGTLNVLAARPGVGKSMLALQIANNCPLPVALYTLEMTAGEQVERMMAAEVEGLTSDGLRSAAVLQVKQNEIAAAMKKLVGSHIRMNDQTATTMNQIASQCRRMKRTHGLGLILVDYLQLIFVEGKGDSRVKEVGQISKGLKRMANELRVPVLAIASLSRECEKRDDKRPILADLRESGEIESDAHAVIFLYRHSEYVQSFAADDRLRNATEIIIKKNRGGKKGIVPTVFDGLRARFYQMAQHDKHFYTEALKNKKESTNATAF